MLTIKGTLGELRGFCETHSDFKDFNFKIRKSGLAPMSGIEFGDLIEDMVNDALDYVVDATQEFQDAGGRVMMVCSNTDTRTSTAVLRTSGGDTYFGAAFCHKNDHFNGLLGEALACARAIDEYFADRGITSQCEEAMLEVL